MTTETFVGTRSGEAAGVHHDWFPEYTRMMHARNTENPRLGLKRFLLRRFSKHIYNFARLSMTKPDDRDRLKRLTKRRQALNEEIIRAEIALRKIDPGYAVEFPGGFFANRELDRRAELSAYLAEGLDVPTYHLLRRQAREEEHKWFYHKSDEPVSRYLKQQAVMNFLHMAFETALNGVARTVPDPYADKGGTYAVRTEGYRSPGPNFTKVDTFGGQDFYTIKKVQNYEKNILHIVFCNNPFSRSNWIKC